MNEKKVPISLSKSDYAFLNYIQQGILYSGVPISKAFDFSDILKASVLDSSMKILGDWENQGKQTVEEFLKEIGIADFKLPKTNEEFDLGLKLDISKSIMKNYLKRVESDSIPEEESERMKEYGTEHLGSTTMRESGMSNFILKLKGEEISLFDSVKTVLERFKKNTVSYSEMTRVFFRNTFINVEHDDVSKQLNRFGLLSSFYIGGIYEFNPVESTLLLYHSVGMANMPKISKEGLERLKNIYSDETLFKIYIDEISNELSRESPDPLKRRKIPKGEKTHSHRIIASQNKLLDEKYKSSVIYSVGFHSMFLGYSLLLMEWFWDQHKLPLLTSFLMARNEIDYSFVHPQLVNALSKFKQEMEHLFDFSKEYRENLVG
jgi:hypothetical protein